MAATVSDVASAQAADRYWAMPVREPLAITLSCSPDRGRRTGAHRDPGTPGELPDQRALMVAAWCSERLLRSIAKQPPAPRLPVEPPKGLTFDQALRLARRQRA